MSDGCCRATAGALSWVDAEIAGCRLGDKRLVERLRRLLEAVRELGRA
ncbi:MAG: transposase DNA-binding-containing protein [Alphaproteobacteria bacterium]